MAPKEAVSPANAPHVLMLAAGAALAVMGIAGADEQIVALPPLTVAGVALLVAAPLVAYFVGTDALRRVSGALPTPEQLRTLILGRRSLYPRDFTGEPVETYKLEAMIEAATWAPTHKLTQPWRFVVLGGETKRKFEELTIQLCRERLGGDKAEATAAKLARKQGTDWPKVYCYIAICLQPTGKVPEWEELAAVSAAAQNLALTASCLGVAGYWSSWQEAARTAPEMKEFLGLKPTDTCLGVFSCGVAKAATRPGSRTPWREVTDFRL